MPTYKTRINSYFKTALFKEAPYSNSINRMGIALGYILYHWYILGWDIFGLYSKQSYFYNISCYTPKGILAFFSGYEIFLDNWGLIYWINLIALLFFLIGFMTNVSSIVLLFTKLIFIGLTESINKDGSWCHGENIVLIAHIAFLFASPGKISIDYLLVKKNPKLKWLLYPIQDFNWSNWLTALAVALMFFNAFCWKIYNSGMAWAFSDNMRNLLILQYTMVQTAEIPWYIYKIIQNQYLYKGLALLNLIIQCAPIIGILFYNRWKLRVLFGFSFVLEVLGLYYIMGLWDVDWIFLYTFFIDWDRLFKKSNLPMVGPKPMSKLLLNSIKVFTFLIIGAYTVSAFIFPLGSGFCYKLNLYPFSSYAMYSENVAKKPYYIHHSYEREALSFEIFGLKSENPEMNKKYIADLLQINFSDSYLGYQNLDQKKEVLNMIAVFLKDRLILFDSLYIFNGFYSVDPYPGDPHPKMKNEGKYGVIYGNGDLSYLSIHSYSNEEGKTYLLIKSIDSAFDIKRFQVGAIYDRRIVLKKIKYKFVGDTVYYELDKVNGYYSFFIYGRDNQKYARFQSGIFDHYWADAIIPVQLSLYEVLLRRLKTKVKHWLKKNCVYSRYLPVHVP
jgi:hypothetical protein